MATPRGASRYPRGQSLPLGRGHRHRIAQPGPAQPVQKQGRDGHEHARYIAARWFRQLQREGSRRHDHHRLHLRFRSDGHWWRFGRSEWQPINDALTSTGTEDEYPARQGQHHQEREAQDERRNQAHEEETRRQEAGKWACPSCGGPVYLGDAWGEAVTPDDAGPLGKAGFYSPVHPARQLGELGIGKPDFNGTRSRRHGNGLQT